MKLKNTLFQFFIVIVIFIFLGKYFFKYYYQLSQYDLTFNYPYLSISFLFFIINGFLLPFIWKRILKFLGVSINYRKLFEVYILSSLARYIPGKIWHVLGRVYLIRDNNINRNVILTSQGIELILMLFSGIIIFLLSLLCGLDLNQTKNILWVIAFIPILFILLYPPVLQIIVNVSAKIFHFDSFPINIGYLNIAELILLFLAFWSISGIAFFFLINALFDINIYFLFVTIGIFAISSVVGILSFLTPAGLGIKEGILSLLLSFYIPLSIAIVISLFARIFMVLTEVITASIIIILKRFYYNTALLN